MKQKSHPSDPPPTQPGNRTSTPPRLAPPVLRRLSPTTSHFPVCSFHSCRVAPDCPNSWAARALRQLLPLQQGPGWRRRVIQATPALHNERPINSAGKREKTVTTCKRLVAGMKKQRSRAQGWETIEVVVVVLVAVPPRFLMCWCHDPPPTETQEWWATTAALVDLCEWREVDRRLLMQRIWAVRGRSAPLPFFFVAHHCTLRSGCSEGRSAPLPRAKCMQRGGVLHRCQLVHLTLGPPEGEMRGPHALWWRA